MSPRPVREIDSWTIARHASAIGRIRLLEIEDPKEPVRFYRVENLAGQWLGYIDDSGRVYKYEPFEQREKFCGVYPMQEGVAHLFDDGQAVEIVGSPGTAAANARKKADQKER